MGRMNGSHIHSPLGPSTGSGHEHKMVRVASAAHGAMEIRLSGAWTMGAHLPPPDHVLQTLSQRSGVTRIAFEASGITAWDTGLLIFLKRIIEQCQQDGIETDWRTLPDGVQRLLALAFAVPERRGARKEAQAVSTLDRVGLTALGLARSAPQMLGFLGEASLAFLKLLAGKARFRRVDLTLTIQECGAEALPIVTLISVLVGMILAFVGAVQLRQFGAEIYVADLVGLGMAREMGAMMTAVIMAGRTGAAFAAQLGTMRVNQELDALVTMGFPPMEFLVLPRMLALMLMMPLLCIYADAVGIIGGALVGVTMLDLSILEYYSQTKTAVTLTHLSVGLVKSAVFGGLVAIAGCLRGMQCGNSSAAVGLAATSAVVTGIVFIIVSDAVLTILYTILGV